MRSDVHDVGPVLLGATHNERDELADLLGVEGAALGRAPRGHRVARRRVRLAARDRQPEEVLPRLERRRILLEGVVLVGRDVERLARQRLAGHIVLAVAESQLAVTRIAEVREQVLAALDRRLHLLVSSRRAQRQRTARDDLEQEVTTHEPQEREQHHATRDDLAIEVAGDLQRIRRRWDRRDPVRRGLLDRGAGTIVLTEELHTGRGLLVRLDLLLVVGDEAEEPDEREEQQQADRGEDEVRVEGHSVISRSFGFQAFAARVSTLSGFVSTTIAPFTSVTWKRSRPRGAGPPMTTAVCLSYSEP